MKNTVFLYIKYYGNNTIIVLKTKFTKRDVLCYVICTKITYCVFIIMTF